jgi:hypothetical protein
MSKASEDSARPNSTTSNLGDSGNVERDRGYVDKVFDDGVGKKTILPFFSDEPCEEVLKLIQARSFS